ncbi:uncharacterized protein Z518_02036 [Rhinocladiella mackenziei CBS 650.93]|uniref:ATP-dependent RNA helicase ROK1 n=1 Tax=Rhinocladiella mackenziei CBS 650.93 TaxID=1442369 RepID=A0A0D2HA81_9EURO|nr:uncharacterized protein Z518_02036 [Rhinocladiella mackenziei CBS 650.93]KIX07383.1 hypothetical protein Z518_02036 [Rhinocladiella mackenziei CBS 650.93]
MDALKLLSRSTGLKTRLSNPFPQDLPSASGQLVNKNGLDPIFSRKRKRDSDVPGDNPAPNSPSRLSEEEIRHIQKRHKIKIVDLNRFRTASETSESRKSKSQKERSRIFPQPLISFDQLRSHYNVNAALLCNVTEQAYFEPTEVQTATLPLLLRGANEGASTEPDLLTIAPTGSGKTLAYLIPLIDKISKGHRGGGNRAERHARAIVLAPTKELVSQIENEGRKLCVNTGVQISAVKKGMRLFEGQTPTSSEDSDDQDTPETGDRHTTTNRPPPVKADIWVSTPLSLVHILCPSWEDDDDESIPAHSLPDIEALILDEADVLLDPLFRSQTLTIWSACTSPSLQISMWSATIGSNIEELAIKTISERQERLGLSRQPHLLRTIIGLKDTSLPTISHRLTYTATESGKLLGMRQLLHPSRPVRSSKGTEELGKPLRPPFLVFTQTIARAQSLYTELQYDIPVSAGGSSRVAVLHSSLSDHARSSIMQRFRQGQIWILITTDLLSRGVDFKGVNVVVNYDIPTTVAGYVHRAGRTGRVGREGGVCVSFYTKEDIQYVKGIANVISASEKQQMKSKSNTEANSGKAMTASSPTATSSGIQPWLLHALPGVSKSARKDLKLHGVESRRAIRSDDDEKTKRMKRKARIGTQSGYQRRETNRKRGAVEGSLRAKRREEQENANSEEWEGFGWP